MLIEIALLGGVSYWFKGKKNQPTFKKVIALESANKQRPTLAQEPAITQRSTIANSAQLFKDLRTALSADERSQLHTEIDNRMITSMEEARKKSSSRLRLSIGATTLALLGGVSPVFTVLGTIGVLYLSRRMFLRAWKDIGLKHYLSSNLIGIILMLGMLASGHLILAAFAGVMGGLFAKIIDRVEANAQQQLVSTFVAPPEKVWVLKDDVEIQIDFRDITVDDVIVVNAGEIIPVDGLIQQGLASIDQKTLTGESEPVEKSVEDEVFASTLLLSGRIYIRVKTSGEATVAAKINHVLNYTQSYKDTIITRGRKISDGFIPVTFGLSAITLPLQGVNAATAMLFSGTGGTMSILGPISVLIYSQILARQGILIKDGRSLEMLRQVNTIVFDKTGTLTLEQPTVARIHHFGQYSADEVLRYAAAAEYRQPHPIAKAILAKAEAMQLELPALDEASYEVGYGIKVVIEGRVVRVGSARFLQREGIQCSVQNTSGQSLVNTDNSLIYIGIDDGLAGILEMQPTIRPEAYEVVTALKDRGFKLVIISGDHQAPTENIAKLLGIEHYFAEVLPEDKASLVNDMKDAGDFVCFIGDGINDTIALKSAQLSISLKGASTAATESAQIIFMDGTLKHMEQLFLFMDEFEETMNKNLVSSVLPGLISIGGIYFLHFGVLAAMGLTYIGCFLGLFNSISPLLKHQNSNLFHENMSDEKIIDLTPKKSPPLKLTD